MARRWWKWLLAAAVVLPLLVWGFDRVQMIYWVGSTDLVVEFAIMDDTTGTSIPRARVEIQQSEGGFYEDREEREFVLVAGGDGLAFRECRQSMCFGTRSGLGFTDTFAVHLPYWRFRVLAGEHEPSEWIDLDAPQYIRQTRRAGTGEARLTVPVCLHKKHAEAATAPDRRGR
ncbi:MAG TPA: hypothetical protein VN688_27960 [Gemmataceae bacterium]|nr:hypothetical protein [Gemmataceae bacterium]